MILSRALYPPPQLLRRRQGQTAANAVSWLLHKELARGWRAQFLAAPLLIVWQQHRNAIHKKNFRHVPSAGKGIKKIKAEFLFQVSPIREKRDPGLQPDPHVGDRRKPGSSCFITFLAFLRSASGASSKAARTSGFQLGNRCRTAAAPRHTRSARARTGRS